MLNVSGMENEIKRVGEVIDTHWSDFFSKPKCYPGQNEAMDNILEALSDGKPVLFEGACGTGKTLSALAPALSIARSRGKKVVIATNLHQQMEQFIEEAREIKKKTDIKAVVLKGKAHMCPLRVDEEECEALGDGTHRLVKKINSRMDLDDILRLQNQLGELGMDDARKIVARSLSEDEGSLPPFCPFLLKSFLTVDDRFGKWLFEDVRHPEEVLHKAKAEGLCAYAVVKSYLCQASLLICNYHHILNENIRFHILQWMDSGLDELIVIFDEAHNVESVARDIAKMTLSETTIAEAVMELGNVGVGGYLIGEVPVKEDVKSLLKTVQSAFNIIRRNAELGEREPKELLEIRIRPPKGGEDVFLNKLQNRDGLMEKAKKAYELGVKVEDYEWRVYGKVKRSRIRSVARFIIAYVETEGNPKFYPTAQLATDKDKVRTLTLELHCCIPTHVTQPVMDGAYGVVLMSATLQPFRMTRDTLGITKDPVEMAYPTSYPLNRRLTIAVGTSPFTSKNRTNPEVVKQIEDVISDVVDGTPGNILVLFPTMAEARKYYNRFKSRSGVKTLLDSSTNTVEVKNEFFDAGKNGRRGVLFSYMWGKLTEGVDFKNDRLRSVVIIGVPYRTLNDLNRALQNAYQVIYGMGTKYGMTYPAIRRVRQAVGRAVRAPDDYGARVLVDYRYTIESDLMEDFFSVYSEFPLDEREEIQDVYPGEVQGTLEQFFKNFQKK